MTNDAWVGADKFRTAAAEIGVGETSLGFNLFTTAPPGGERSEQIGKIKILKSMWGFNPKGTYSLGDRIWAGLYLGIRSGNLNSRLGIDSPVVQDFFQDGLHFLIGTPNFNYLNGPEDRPFLQSGYINPFSLYPF